MIKSSFVRSWIFSFLFFISSSLIGSLAYAKVYDWVPVDRGDLKVTVHPKVLIEFRLELINRARSTLDLVTFDQRLDEAVGKPVLDALERAAERGVKIRFAIAKFMTPVTDPQGKIQHRLKDIASRYKNFEYSFAGGSSMFWRRGWQWMDGIHEKLLISDRRWGMTTGAGHADQYLHWLDTGFFFKGQLVRQSVEAFNHLWESILRENPNNGVVLEDVGEGTRPQVSQTQFLNEDLLQRKLPVASANPRVQLSSPEVEELSQLMLWLESESEGRFDYKGRILHFDFLDQMRNYSNSHFSKRIWGDFKKKPAEYSLKNRLNILEDPIVNEVVEQLKTATGFRLTTFATLFHPKLKETLIQRLKEEMPFSILTNSEKSHATIHPIGPSIGWVDSLPDLDDVLMFKSTSAFLLTKRTAEDPIYLHRKMLILRQDASKSGGRQSSVIFGSHNLTFASSTTIDEMSFQIEGDGFANLMDAVFDESTRLFAEPVDEQIIGSKRRFSWLSRVFEGNWKWLY